jgi:hypothetical protein
LNVGGDQTSSVRSCGAFTQIIWQHALRPIGLGQNTQKVLAQPHWQFYKMFHFVDTFTGEAAFLEGRIARPWRRFSWFKGGRLSIVRAAGQQQFSCSLNRQAAPFLLSFSLCRPRASRKTPQLVRSITLVEELFADCWAGARDERGNWERFYRDKGKFGVGHWCQRVR